MYEAGALAKHLNVGRVVPLRVDLTSAQVEEPLASFQGRQLDKEGVRKLIRDIMALRDSPLPQVQVDVIFEDAWPRLETKVAEAMQQNPDAGSPRRSSDEILEEVLEGVRRIEREQSRVRRLERLNMEQRAGRVFRTAADIANASDSASATVGENRGTPDVVFIDGSLYKDLATPSYDPRDRT